MTGIIEMKIFAEFVGIDGVLARREVFVVRRNADQPHLEDFGLTLEEGKSMLQRQLPTPFLGCRSRARLLVSASPLPRTPISKSMCAWIALICSA